MTFGELVKEQDYYKYSQEYYNLVKECAELTVIGTYLDNQAYMAENTHLLESVSKTYGENYFAESVSENDIQALETSFMEKANGAWATFKRGLAKFLQAIINMLSRWVAKLTESEAAVQKTAASVNELMVKGDDKQKNELVHVMNEVHGKAKKKGLIFGKAPAYISDPAKKVITVQFRSLHSNEGDGAAEGSGGVAETISAVFAKDVVHIVSANRQKAVISTAAIAKIYSEVVDMMKNGNITVSSVRGVRNMLTNAMKEGFSSSVNPNKVKDIVHRLENCSKNMNEYNEKLTKDGSDGNADMAQAITDFNKFTAEFTAVIANTIEIVNSFMVFKTEAVNAIASAMMKGGIKSADYGSKGYRVVPGSDE